MSTTSTTLLRELQGDPQGSAWGRAVDIYAPFLEGFLCRVGVPRQDREDLIQSVLEKVVGSIRKFDRRKEGSFRKWLRRITHHVHLDYIRAGRRLPPLLSQILGSSSGEFEPAAPIQPDEWDDEYNRWRLNRAIDIVRPEFSEAMWSAFIRYVHYEAELADLARELATSIGALKTRFSRMRTRLKVELEKLDE